MRPDRHLGDFDNHDHRDCYHNCYYDCYSICTEGKHDNDWCQREAQDAAFHDPGSSDNTTMYLDHSGHHDDVHVYPQGEAYGTEQVMTPAPADDVAHGSENVDYNPDQQVQYVTTYWALPYAHYTTEIFYPPGHPNHDQHQHVSNPLNHFNGAVAPTLQHYHAHEPEPMDDEEDMDGEEESDDDEAMVNNYGPHHGYYAHHAQQHHVQSAANDPIPPPTQPSFSQGAVVQGSGYSLGQPPGSDDVSLDGEEEELMLDPFPPVHMSNPNPSILGSENYGLIDFLRYWAYGNVLQSGHKLPRPGIRRVLKQATSGVERVYYSDLRGDGCDIQGLDWDSMNTTRSAAREIRRYTYKNYVNRQGSDIHVSTEVSLPTNDSFFRFRRMDVRRDISLAHFQLRSVLACPSRTHAYYPSPQGINMLNTATKKTSLAMNLRAFAGMAAPAISTLDANCGVLMAGTFNGDYFLQSLTSADKKSYSEGQISNDVSGITNHIKIYKPRRSGSPAAAIASNDQGFRLLDLQTEKYTAKFTYPFALNCSAMSPDGRLRVVVGDDLNVLITNAETGEILQQLGGHRDYGFACDWSDNGYHVATGFQDKTVKIWDARHWRNANGISTPICTIATEMAGVRNLRFSPSGSGRPLLAAAEEADFINVIDAQSFASKQLIDVFGEIGGVAFTNDGQDLNVLCCDAHRGGLLQFERCSFGVDEPLTGGVQRVSKIKEGASNQWEYVQRRRPPTYIDGPGVF